MGGKHKARADFRQKAERFMGNGPRESTDKKGGGPIEMFTEKLGLNVEQKAKVTQILEKTHQEIDEVGESIRSAIIEIREKGNKQIMDILTPEQEEKFKALQKEFKRVSGPREARGVRGSVPEQRPHLNEELPPPQE